MKIAVALSGGVDSSAAVLTLKRAGHEVFGVTMRICPDLSGLPQAAHIHTQPPMPGHGCACCVAPCACQDATQAAKQLGIRLELLDLREEFEQKVITPFMEEFISGQTPNPCAHCNREMKFGRLREIALGLGAEAFATGHYARCEEQAGRTAIYRAQDAQRDQTYFMSWVKSGQFHKVWFPIGDITKPQARTEVADAAVHPQPVVTSSEICFLRDINYVDFLRWRRPASFLPGEIVDSSGRVLGEHVGLPAYTVGQRRGLGIAASAPLYVIRLEAGANRVVAGPDRELWQQRARLQDMNWLIDPPEAETSCLAQIRYRQAPVPVRVLPLPDRQVELLFEKPVRAVTPGQCGALYQGDRLLGGGRIADFAGDK